MGSLLFAGPPTERGGRQGQEGRWRAVPACVLAHAVGPPSVAVPGSAASARSASRLLVFVSAPGSVFASAGRTCSTWRISLRVLVRLLCCACCTAL